MHEHQHDHDNISNLRLAFFLNVGFTLFEIVGGLMTNSTAILADAIHDLGDSIALGQAWYLESLAGKKGNRRYTYGYRRFSLLGGVISALILLLGSFYVLSESIPRIFAPESPDASGMIMLAIVGVAVNGFAMLRLSKGHKANIRMVALHLLEDVLGWLAVLAVGIVLLFRDIPQLDPILAIMITLYILTNVLKRLKAIVPVFLQATPSVNDLTNIEQEIEALDHVADLHHLHIWSQDEEHRVLTAHVLTDQVLEPEQYRQLKQDLRNIIQRYDISHSTLEVEWPDETCRIDGDQSDLCRR